MQQTRLKIPMEEPMVGGGIGGINQMEALNPDDTKTQGRTDGGRSEDGVSGPTTSDGAERFGDPGEAEVIMRSDGIAGSGGLEGPTSTSTRGETRVPED